MTATAPRPSVLADPDPELVRLRVLLAALRPDAGDPYEPPPVEATVSAAPMPRDPTASHGGIPRGVNFGRRRTLDPEAPPRALVDVMRELAALPPDARAVLLWVQRHGSLASGARGLFCDVGLAFAGASQALAWERDVGARREGAYLLGRRLVWAAAGAWGR